LRTSKTRSLSSRQSFERAISARAACQSEINSLLQRKSSWGGDDVARFTSVCSQEHTLVMAENEAKVIRLIAAAPHRG